MSFSCPRSITMVKYMMNAKIKNRKLSFTNQTKGAVDNVDKLVRTYTYQRKSRRWPMIFFQYLLDIAAYNVAVVFFAVNSDFNNGEPQRRRLFLERLGYNCWICSKPETVQTTRNARDTKLSWSWYIYLLIMQYPCLFECILFAIVEFDCW